MLASKQSSTVESRAELEKLFKKYERKYEGKEIPMPDYWGGYRLEHKEVEFWQEEEIECTTALFTLAMEQRGKLRG